MPYVLNGRLEGYCSEFRISLWRIWTPKRHYGWTSGLRWILQKVQWDSSGMESRSKVSRMDEPREWIRCFSIQDIFGRVNTPHLIPSSLNALFKKKINIKISFVIQLPCSMSKPRECSTTCKNSVRRAVMWKQASVHDYFWASFPSSNRTTFFWPLDVAADSALPYFPPSALMLAPFSTNSRTTSLWPLCDAADSALPYVPPSALIFGPLLH